MPRPAGSYFGKEDVGQGSFVAMSVRRLRCPGEKQQRIAPMSCVWAMAAQAGGILMESVPQQLPAIHYKLLMAGLKIPHGMML